ncbi:NADP-binding protein [Dacryopinax primogenitus]|uniref:NADP-binding protein n=1 Tax=Dacryopinax primogenitus (strain DJM 731) TaxID=1858805 RepID=M5G4E9_DACPD|nr:NADP-binding protein [Dacryopinax primogenitus]EJU05136.1 NADP-binding protein [Dacryopinax primogenitus]
MPAPPEDLPVTQRHSIYPGIEPELFVGSLQGKVVFITGASRGIGEATAIAFAKSGAALFLASRKQETLDIVKADILDLVPGVRIETHVTDVTEHESVKEAVQACVREFGKIDVVISNSGASEDFAQTIAQQDPEVWWWTWEVNVKGSFNVAHYTLSELTKTRGYFVFVSSIGAQIQFPGASSYQSSKHAINRIAEFAAMETATDDVKVFAIHPGGVKTELSKSVGEVLEKFLTDDIQLPAWTMVRLVQGKDDYLSGRYVSVNWDLDEVHDQWKDTIINDDALKNRLALPSVIYQA